RRASRAPTSDAKLDHGRLRVWHDVQQKVRAYAQATDLSTMKFDDFIRIVDHVRRLHVLYMSVDADRVSEFSAASLSSCRIHRKQSVNYCRHLSQGSHRKELRIVLENEGMEPCPSRQLLIYICQEFNSAAHHLSCSQPAAKQQGSVAQRPVAARRRKRREHIMEQDLFENSYSLDHDDSTSDDDVPEELKQDYIEEGVTGESHAYRPLPMRCMPRRPSWKATKAPPICHKHNSDGASLVWVIVSYRPHNFCKYIQMMDCLRTIAFDVTICMSQLFDFYLYAVYSFFASEMMEVNERTMSSKLRTTLRRITDNLIARDATAAAAAAGDPAGDRRDRVPHPHVSPIVDLSDPTRLHGLAERVAAAESLVYLATQFEFLQPCLEAVIPPQKKAFLQQFYSQTVSTATELRKPVYQIVAVHAVDYEQVHQQIAALKWEIKEIMSQHNTYVDVVLREFQVFSMRLAEVSKRVPIPKEAYNVLWEHCIRLASRTFVEG
ncbi:PREDICTED: syndetin-like, partial [Priapulus caudatus]|uniref:Syndetin-like n=1 Tax=Priapulus caudatus TaxID=37621 RepID=A0ABM1F3K1_PRICU